ncbi:hypothetical protein WN944_018496 [Citrus x changshan-huyou]|uniref:Uncharacterized protein n=1 Tax=Citrus x changshan-huyou TaxID=2935761 RepID=A0AAP0LUW9_9ROSI
MSLSSIPICIPLVSILMPYSRQFRNLRKLNVLFFLWILIAPPVLMVSVVRQFFLHSWLPQNFNSIFHFYS